MPHIIPHLTVSEVGILSQVHGSLPEDTDMVFNSEYYHELKEGTMFIL